MIKKKMNAGKISFLFLFLLMMVMGVATIIEKTGGTDKAWQLIYDSWWFAAGWAVVLIFALLYYFQKKSKFTSTSLLHVSFGIILTGALITKVSAVTGFIHLNAGQHQTVFSEDEGALNTHQLPFAIRLDSFRITTYPGTNTPADYTSYLTIQDQTEHRVFQTKASMNRIVRYKGYRFYQFSYNEDATGSVLSVNKDVWGVAVTYTGYAWMALSMLLILFSPKGNFRKLLNHQLLKKTIPLFVLLISFSQRGLAENRPAEQLNFEKSQAARFGQLHVLYNGRIAPLQTVALDFTLKLTGKREFSGFTAEQFFTGWLFFPERWLDKPVFLVKEKSLQQYLGVIDKYVSYNQLFDQQRKYKLSACYENQDLTGKDFLQKAARNLDEKVNLIAMLQSGTFLKLFPLKSRSGTVWYAPGDELPVGTNPEDSLFIRQSLAVYLNFITEKENEKASRMVNEITLFQQKMAGNTLPSAWGKNVERTYNRLDLFSLLFKINLTTGLLAVIFLIGSASGRRKNKLIGRLIQVVLLISFALQTAGLAMRSMISGHLPLSNGFEIMLGVAWAILLTGIWLRRKSEFIPAAGLFLSGICLLVAHFGMMNPRMTLLMPVLNSFWLNLHVSCIILSYALAAFISLLGFIVLLLMGSANRKNRIKIGEHIERLTIISKIMLYISVCFMGAGIFIGAIWANVSWGNYWAWDPKETWAMISFLVSASLIHGQTLSVLRQTFWYHFSAFFAFLSILMTFFGVNFFLGGMHSYAGEGDLQGVAMITGCLVFILVFIFLGIKKYRYERIWPEGLTFDH